MTGDKVWHWTYTATIPASNDVKNVEIAQVHGPHAYRKQSYPRVVPVELSEASCPEFARKPHDVDTWNSPLNPSEHDMCRFSKVPLIVDAPVDPRSMHILGSGTPYFLLVAVQVALQSHVVWTAAPLKSFHLT
eukprot:3933146-Rhodomonas_salina.2